MHQRQLGKSGPKLSAIGIGAMSFTDFYGATSEAASHATTRSKVEANLLSTSRVIAIYSGFRSICGGFMSIMTSLSDLESETFDFR